MVTIILPVSRSEHLQKIFSHLELLQCNSSETNLFVYVDGNLQLYQDARNFTVNSKFKEKVCIYRKQGIPNVGSVKRRRQRISDIHNEIKAELKQVDYVFLIEDDTLFPLNTLERLLSLITFRNDIGIVSGVQLGRWGWAHIGAWAFDDVYNPTRIESIELGEGIKEVDATGLYCCLSKFEHYINNNFEPYLDILGPDVQFGIELRKQGLRNYIDYNLKCSHLTPKETITFSNQQVVSVALQKDGDKWKQGLSIDLKV